VEQVWAIAPGAPPSKPLTSLSVRTSCVKLACDFSTEHARSSCTSYNLRLLFESAMPRSNVRTCLLFARTSLSLWFFPGEENQGPANWTKLAPFRSPVFGSFFQTLVQNELRLLRLLFRRGEVFKYAARRFSFLDFFLGVPPCSPVARSPPFPISGLQTTGRSLCEILLPFSLFALSFFRKF